MSRKSSANLITKQFSELLPRYETLAVDLQKQIRGLLEGEGIGHAFVTSRIKSLKSFLQKIKRKGYTDPFSQSEDICGIRIICYAIGELPIVTELITKSFTIHESIDKADNLDLNEFGYRSLHYIVSPKSGNSDTTLKAEIQLRTILMHAWAEIEHDLYKPRTSLQISDSVRRAVYSLSAKLEDADLDLDNLCKQTGFYRNRKRNGKLTPYSFDPEISFHVFQFAGRLDVSLAYDVELYLRDKLTELAATDMTLRVAIDLTEVEYLSSSGFRALIATRRLVNSIQQKYPDRKVGMILFGVRPSVMRIFHVTDLESLFSFATNKKAFLAKIRKHGPDVYEGTY